MRNSSSASSFGDIALCALFFSLSVVAGLLVVALLLIATSPVVSMFPADSGASEIVTGVALLWGVVIGCVVAVFTIGPWRRLHSRAQLEHFDDADAVPLELIGRPLPRRRVANDARARYAAVAADGFEDDEDELLLEDEVEVEEPRHRGAARRYRHAS
jgi:hypothetical protein